MKKIIVTEENFNEILEKLQKICNTYRMFEFYRVFKDGVEDKDYRRNPIGFINRCVEFRNLKGEICYKNKKQFRAVNTFIDVEKHKFREEYENETISEMDKRIYEERKGLIRLETSADTVIVLCESSEIQFIPFGFIIWDNFDLSSDGTDTKYKYIFIPDFRKKINLEDEINLRNKEYEEADRWMQEYYDRLFEEEEELEMHEYFENMYKNEMEDK